MKSILQEASSVAAAIQKAWDEAGQPKEFTVKVLEQGEKNFFGFTKRPAVVSLFFEPVIQRGDGHRSERRPLPKHKEPQQRPQPVKQVKERRRIDEMQPEKKEKRILPPAPERPQTRPAQPKEQPPAFRHRDASSDTSQKSVAHHEQVEGPVKQKTVNTGLYDGQWTPEMSGTIREWLNDMLAIMNVSVPYTIKEEQRSLVINFENKILDAIEEEGMLFASFAYLLLQSLKKKHKNKFKGLRIILKTPQRQ